MFVLVRACMMSPVHGRTDGRRVYDGNTRYAVPVVANVNPNAQRTTHYAVEPSGRAGAQPVPEK